MVVDGNPLTKEEASRGGVLPGLVVGCSSSKVLLHLQRMTAMRSLGSDDDRV
jgi:hypothetical protein